MRLKRRAKPAAPKPPKSWPWRVVRFVLIFLVIAHLAGGLVYAAMLDKQGLKVDHAGWEHDLVVRTVAGGRITVTDTGAVNHELRKAKLMGLTWKGGFAQLDGPVTLHGNRVTRSFHLLSGHAPRPGTKVGVDDFTWPDGPRPGMRAVKYADPLGPMPAYFQPGVGTTWAILVHGKGGKPAEMFRMMRSTNALHLPALTIGYRNDVGAPEDPSKKYQYGATEWRDLQAAVLYAQAHGAQHIVLGGVSMGGSIIASFLEHSKLAPLVQGLVLDAPMLDFSATVSWTARTVGIPGGPPARTTLAWTAKRFASVMYGVHWSRLDYLDNVKWADLPTLVIHGTGDDTVPIATSKELARKNHHVTIVEIPGAGHVESWNWQPTTYDHLVQRFLATVVH